MIHDPRLLAEQEMQRRIAAAIRKNPNLLNKEIIAKFSVSPSTVGTVRRKMRDGKLGGGL